MRKDVAPFRLNRSSSQIRLVSAFLLFFSPPAVLLAKSVDNVAIKIPADLAGKGEVADNSAGQGRSGIGVFIQGTSKGTTTDEQLSYPFTFPDNAVLQFSGAGYDTKQTKTSSLPLIVTTTSNPAIEQNDGYN